MDKAWRSQLVFYQLSRKEDLCLLITAVSGRKRGISQLLAFI